MNQPKPILILGDAPDMQGGLSRITRDIAGQLSRNPKFRVGTLGRGAATSRLLPWAQYAIHQERGQWGQGDIQRVWQDFAGKERGAVCTIWDPTRCLWLSRPEFSGDPDLTQWLQQGHFDLWGYVTMDATGPQDKLSGIARDALLGYRRLLAYTKWSEGVIERSIGQLEARKRGLDWAPHGLDFDKWVLRDRAEGKSRLFPFVHESDKLVGVIGTNQPRKDWGLIANVCRLLLDQDRHIKFWWHSDLLERYWSIPALLHDFGLEHCTQVSLELTQDELNWRYCSCDLTLHPGLGEGFGYPIFESLCCGTPVIHGDYAGGADVLRQAAPPGIEDALVTPQAWRLDGLNNQLRPVFDPAQWADQAQNLLQQEYAPESLRASVAFLSWQNLWQSVWSRWFDGGL